jgi:hypothetical protein
LPRRDLTRRRADSLPQQGGGDIVIIDEYTLTKHEKEVLTMNHDISIDYPNHPYFKKREGNRFWKRD